MFVPINPLPPTFQSSEEGSPDRVSRAPGRKLWAALECSGVIRQSKLHREAWRRKWHLSWLHTSAVKGARTRCFGRGKSTEMRGENTRDALLEKRLGNRAEPERF